MSKMYYRLQGGEQRRGGLRMKLRDKFSYDT